MFVEIMRNRYRVNIILIFIFLISSAISCNRSVYLYSDEFGSSKFVIYKDIFEYFERTPDNLSFKTWGDYSLTDSTIVFEFRDIDRIPYNYYGESIETTGSNSNLNYLTLTVVNRLNNEPMAFVTIKLKDKFNNLIFGTMTDSDGIAEIAKDEKIQYMEIGYLGYVNVVLDFEKYKDQNLTIKLDSLNPNYSRVFVVRV